MPSSDPTPFDHNAALAACACGEQGALRRLYERENRFLMGVALRIVRSGALSAVRASARTVSVDEELLDDLHDAEPQASPDMLDAFSMRSTPGQLDHCLERLDVAKRNCVLQANLDGCIHAEIFERLSAPLGSVKAWIRRGMASLKACLA